MRGNYYFILDAQVVGHYVGQGDTPGEDAKRERDRKYPDCAVVVLLGDESPKPIGHIP